MINLFMRLNLNIQRKSRIYTAKCFFGVRKVLLKLKLSDTKVIFLGQIGAGTLSLIATIFIARYTGPTIFGVCASIILVFSVILDAIDFGACSWASRELSKKSISLFQYHQIMKFKTRLALLPILFLPLINILIDVNTLTSALFLLYQFLWILTN
jgi:hypothetical protein